VKIQKAGEVERRLRETAKSCANVAKQVDFSPSQAEVGSFA
jgi:hypothetical protein